MQRSLLVKTASMCLTAATLAAATPLADGRLDLQPQSRLWVDGTSTVRSFTCKATAMEASIEATGPNSVAQLMLGQKAVRTVVIRIPTEKLDCGNGTMNEHMRKSIKASANPVIEFRLASYDMNAASSTIDGTLRGVLALGGQERPLEIQATANPAPEGQLHVVGGTTIRMTQWGLKPPSLMLGTMKVAPDVKVNFDLLLKD